MTGTLFDTLTPSARQGQTPQRDSAGLARALNAATRAGDAEEAYRLLRTLAPSEVQEVALRAGYALGRGTLTIAQFTTQNRSDRPVRGQSAAGA